MVIDSIDQIGEYLPEAYLTAVLEWLKTTHKDSNSGYYEIAGDAIYARILSYPTQQSFKCKIEAHNQYIDIQSTLIGKEGIRVYFRENLEAKGKYDEDNDVIF